MAFYLKRKIHPGFSLGTPKDLGTLLWIAEQKGFLTDEGLRMKIHIAPFSRESMDKMIDGEIDSAFLIETNVAYLGYMKPKIPIKCIASIEKRFSDNIVLRTEKGEEATPQDIKGKLVAFMPRTTSHTFLVTFLDHHNIRKEEIRLKPLTPQAMPDALIRGEVDAICVWEAHTHNTIYSMNELGIKHARFENTGFYFSEAVLAVRKPFLIKQEQNLRRFLNALKKAAELHRTDPVETIPIVARKMNLVGKNHERSVNKNVPVVGPITKDYLRNIDVMAKWISEKDTQYQGHPIPDYTDFIDNSLF